MAVDLLDSKLLEKYSRLILVKDIGVNGLLKIKKLRVAVVGCGATGSHVVDMLARIGVGYIRVIDSDFVDVSNVYRMSLVNEDDVKKALPKAVACAERAQEVNSDVRVEPVIDRVEPENVLDLLSGVDLVFDGTDNITTRLIINEASVEKGFPWVFIGIEGWYANVMLIEPGKSACFSCLIPRPPLREQVNVCDILGVFPSVVSIASSIAVNIAIRHLLGLGDYAGKLYVVNGTDVSIETLDIVRRKDCPICVKHQYNYIMKPRERKWHVRVVCGTNAVEIVPPEDISLDLSQIAKVHKDKVEAQNPYLVKLKESSLKIVLLRNGKAIVDGTTDTSTAFKVYREVLSRAGIRMPYIM